MRNYIYESDLKYTKMIQANYLKIFVFKIIIKKKFKLYVHISKQKINLKLNYIKINSKIYIYSKNDFY